MAGDSSDQGETRPANSSPAPQKAPVDLQGQVEELKKQVEQLQDDKALKVWAEALEDQSTQEVEKRRQKYELWVILTSIVCVSVLAVSVMGIFGLPQQTGNPSIFRDATHVFHGLGLTFGIIGTLTGAYFGIKSSNEARTQAEKARKDAHRLASTLAEQRAPATTEQEASADEKS